MAAVSRGVVALLLGREICMIARRLSFAVGVLLSASLLSGQALTDHAAAIAGATAGVAGARALRDPLTRILQSASEINTPAPPSKNAALTAYPTASTPTQPPPPAFTPSPSPAPAWRRGSRGEVRPVLAATQQIFAAYESAPSASPVTTDQLRAVASGATRAEVVAHLGVPSGRISMDDNGHLVEILQYSARGSRVGSVRCRDGRVESVNTADR